MPAAKLEEAVHLLADNAPSTLVTSSAGLAHSSNVGHALRAVFMIPALMGMIEKKRRRHVRLGGLPLDVSASTAVRAEDLYTDQNFADKRAGRTISPPGVFAKHFQTAAQVHRRGQDQSRNPRGQQRDDLARIGPVPGSSRQAGVRGRRGLLRASLDPRLRGHPAARRHVPPGTPATPLRPRLAYSSANRASNTEDKDKGTGDHKARPGVQAGLRGAVLRRRRGSGPRQHPADGGPRRHARRPARESRRVGDPRLAERGGQARRRQAAQGRATRLQHAVRQAGIRLRDPQGLRLRGASRVRGTGAFALYADRRRQALPARSERRLAPALLHALQTARDPLAQRLYPSRRACILGRATAGASATATWCGCSTSKTRSR